MSNHEDTQYDASKDKISDIYENLRCNSHLEIQNTIEHVVDTNFKEELVYATPIKKSDRCKSGNKNVPFDSKNETTYSQINFNTKQIDTILFENNDNSKNIEDKRIRNFIRDASQQLRKIEPQSFSFLTKEEHFASLVHQNVISKLTNDHQKDKKQSDIHLDQTYSLEELEHRCDMNLENLLKNEKPVEDSADFLLPVSVNSSPCSKNNIMYDTESLSNINREWVMKKIALCLEQRFAYNKSSDTKVNPNHMGCLILGSSGSGKTSICKSILEGSSGTRGILNRRLLSCYFIDKHNHSCHAMSNFIRSLILQMLSHSSYIDANDIVQNSKQTNSPTNNVIKEATNIVLDSLITIKKFAGSNPDIYDAHYDSKHNSGFYATHPPVKCESKHERDSKVDKSDSSSHKKSDNSKSSSPKKKSSKIPILVNRDKKMETNKKTLQTKPCSQKEERAQTEISEVVEPPLTFPKPKSCRTVIANQYYDLLLNMPDIDTGLDEDYIEKNADECFKKYILFPLLEMQPPKTTLLLVVDSIDENPSTESNLFSTLKMPSHDTVNTSKTIADLLLNHIHLFPKWIFLVVTSKKQSKSITKSFCGFKRLTLDDLKKSHVVKDVQEYIINRLNYDFKGNINLTKEIIENLNQLYIKSNGCILYLEKVLNEIHSGFFTFREIKLIPCTLNGLYLYICQKSFNKKQYHKVRPILNILLACVGEVEINVVYNCLRMNNFTIDKNEFEKRLKLLSHIIIYDRSETKIKVFHSSFCDWLVDVKFSTKKFLCDVNEGNMLITMHYIMASEMLCPNRVRKFLYHLNKSSETLLSKNVNIDANLILLESKANLRQSFYTNALNCCENCKLEYINDLNIFFNTRKTIEKYICSKLDTRFMDFLSNFFKPNLPVDSKILKLLMETGIQNVDFDNSPEVVSPDHSEKFLNTDSELADLLVYSENISNDSSILEIASKIKKCDTNKPKAFVHVLASDGNHKLLVRALNACKSPVDLELEDIHGQTALNIAARNGCLEFVSLLVNLKQTYHIDINHADKEGWTPLRSASWGGHTDIVKLLIAQSECAIDFADCEGRTALRAAAWSGHEDILKILIDAGANVNSVDKQGRTSLIAASYMGHYDIVELLLENGANVNHLDLDGRSALCVAALCGSSGYSKVISTLLDHGANTDQVDNDGMSPLLVSSFEGNAEICELLLENGADPDLSDNLGRTSLWAACTAGHSNVVKLLLFWGCSIDCMDSDGRTVLSIATAQGNMETIRQLLDRGLDETHRDNAGWTPLHYAAFEGFSDICIQLLDAGAKIDECDNEGKTALHLAAQEGHNKVLEVLLDIHSSCVDQKAHDGKTAYRLACLEGE